MKTQLKINWIKERWSLDDIEKIYEFNNKAVYSAKSIKWGNVIIKINENKDELASEYNMLKELDGEGSCRVFVYDSEYGILIEERIIPGTELRKEQRAESRISHFIEVFQSIHKEIDNENSFETYLDWLIRADRFCIENNIEEVLRENMHKALIIGQEMFNKYSERVLLHGDLHHDNILKNDNGDYFMIDPKGIIGPAIFDIPRYILNEIDFVSEDERKRHIRHIIDLISEKIKYPVSDIIKLFFMEVILANVWNVEDGIKPNMNQVLMAVEVVKKEYRSR